MKTVFSLSVLIFFYSQLTAQIIIKRDPEIEELVNEVSADSLHSYINVLVSFGTRNTLSVQTENTRGIGAARKWVLQKFNEFARNSRGRLNAVIDTTTLPANNQSVDMPVLLGNVVATLKGTDPNDKRNLLSAAISTTGTAM